MRAVLWMVPGGSSTPGGHVTQWRNTAAALRALGVEARESEDEAPDFDGVDVVHGFGLTAAHIRKAREQGLPVVLSTIYWSKHYRQSGPDGGSASRWVSRARWAAVFAVRSLQGAHHAVAEGVTAAQHRETLAFEAADLLLPNSTMEARAIAHELGVTTPTYVVPNAVDADIFTLPAGAARGQTVVCAGRLEPHKNQLGLIKALSRTSADLVIVGPRHPEHPGYAERCRRSAGPRTTFLPAMAPHDLARLFQRASVHVLPSYFETTGLANLEAALCGAAVVSTERGYAREYFGENAAYCDPSSTSSIHDAVQAAAVRGASEALRERILSCYTWRHTAAATAAAYERACAPPR